MKIREVTVFSEGDSLDLNCWSNVPFLFTKSLEKKGIKVNRVNIYSNKYIRKTIWAYFFKPLLDLLFKGNIYAYEQTFLNRWLVRCRIRKALKRFKDSDLNIYLSYAYLDESSGIPNVLFSDWTSEYVLRYRLKRKPYSFEKAYLDIQRRNIQQADIVLSLFPDIARAMEVMYGRSPIYYLGQNVINNVYEGSLEQASILPLKKRSNILLFIGRETYLSGARLLVRSFEILRKDFPNLELHIVGLTASYFEDLPDNVFVHGYLDKSKPAQKNLYYDLLINSRLFINPTPQWGGYSSTVEAMYFYTPVVISDYSSFVDTFGTEIPFGYYVKQSDGSDLCDCLRKVLTNTAYEQLCIASHKAVSDFTWDNFVDKFLIQVDSVLKIKR